MTRERSVLPPDHSCVMILNLGISFRELLVYLAVPARRHSAYSSYRNTTPSVPNGNLAVVWSGVTTRRVLCPSASSCPRTTDLTRAYRRTLITQTAIRAL